MNTTTPPTVTAAPTAATPKASKPKKVAKVEAKPTPTATENPAKVALLAKVTAAISEAKGKPAPAALVILRNALQEVHASCPDVAFSENKEQRTAQLKALRETRANLGWQQAARMLGDAIANVDGVEQVRRFGARQLVNGSLVATESIRSTLKASKGHRGLSIR